MMAEATLVSVTLTPAMLNGAAAWAEGQTVKFPADLARDVASGAVAAGAPQAVALCLASASALRLQNAFLTRPPRSSHARVNYRLVPGPVRRLIGSAIGRVQRRREAAWAAFPGWPVDLSADVAADLARSAPVERRKTPVLLTHDIDSPEGLRNAHRLFAPMEESFGARSTNYVVPCAWPLDVALIEDPTGA